MPASVIVGRGEANSPFTLALNGFGSLAGTAPWNGSAPYYTEPLD